MRKLTFFLTCLLMIGVGLVNAQSRSISGKVISADDEQPVIGASVIVKGTTIGTVTNVNGNFSISMPNANSKLIVSYVGMKTLEIESAPNMIIRMLSDNEELDEVIVVAYGTSKKSSFTGSASTVTAKSIEKRAISTVSAALEGNTSGVQVSSALGQPGSDVSVRIRGFGSVNASSAPLYIVDGAPFNGRLSDFNPSDIESMTILKDAASTSLYGSSAGNGVVLITTKKASTSTGVTFSTSQGYSNRAYKDYQTVGVYEYYPQQWQMLKNSQVSLGKTEAEAATLASAGIFDKLKYNPFAGIANGDIVGVDGKLNPAATSLKWGDDLNWADQAYRTGHRQEYNIGYSSMQDKSDTYASIGYLNDKGYMIATDFERYSGRINYNINPVKWFKSGLNLALSKINSNISSATSDNSSSYSNLSRYVRNMAPIYPIHKHNLTTGEYLNSKGDPTTNPAEYVYDYDGTRQSDPGRDALVETLWNSRSFVRGTTNTRTYVTFIPMKGLEITANYALDLSDLRRKVYENPKVGDGTAGPARLNILSSRSTTENFNQLITYKNNFDLHSIELLAGHESNKYMYEYFYSMKVAEIIPGVYEFGNYVTISSSDSYTDTYNKEGYFVRANYDYSGKYYVSGSYRHDGSSVFSADNRWGNFWSIGTSWRISEEKFMKELTMVNNLKLRASYGETGNDALSSYYPYQTLYLLGMNNGLEAGAYFTTLANKDLIWETQVSKDIALEFGLFNKVSGSVEFFQKESKDLLFNVAKPTSTGISSLTQNIGKSRNTGIEVELNFNFIKTKDFSATIGGNLTWLKNTIVKLPEANRENGIIDGSKKLLEGHSINEYWLRQWYGVDAATGNGLYVFDAENYNIDKGNLTPTVEKTLVTGPNGEKLTNSYSYAKYDFSGTSLPKYYGGFNLNVAYKGFDLETLFSYSIGSKMLDLNYASLMSNSRYGDGMSVDVQKAWKTAGDVTEVPRLDNTTAHHTSIGQSYSTRWLVSGDYLNFRTLTFGYTIPKKMLSPIMLRSARLSVSAENLFMVKAREGLNPQGQFNGLTYNEYMPSKSITIGLKASF